MLLYIERENNLASFMNVALVRLNGFERDNEIFALRKISQYNRDYNSLSCRSCFYQWAAVWLITLLIYVIFSRLSVNSFSFLLSDATLAELWNGIGNSFSNIANKVRYLIIVWLFLILEFSNRKSCTDGACSVINIISNAHRLCWSEISRGKTFLIGKPVFVEYNEKILQKEYPSPREKTLNIKPGDVVKVVAPARKSSDAALPLMKNYIESLGLVADISENIYSNEDAFYSNTDEFRADDLISAVLDENVKIIWCVRGGAGSIRLIPYLEARLPAKVDHKILIGYSDITVLHLYFEYKYGWQTIQVRKYFCRSCKIIQYFLGGDGRGNCPTIILSNKRIGLDIGGIDFRTAGQSLLECDKIEQRDREHHRKHSSWRKCCSGWSQRWNFVGSCS